MAERYPYRIIISYAYEILDELGQEVSHFYGFVDEEDAEARAREELASLRDDVESVEVEYPG